MTGADPERSRRLAPWIAAALVAACVFLAFAPALDGELLNFDDNRNVTENHAFRGLDAEHLEWMFTTNWMGPYQPLSWLSLAVDRELWGPTGLRESPEAPGYHRTNVVLHALGAAAFLFLALRLLRRGAASASAGQRLGGAVFAALLFAVHPLRVESVAWVTERRDVLSGLFFVLALTTWTRHVDRARALAPSPRRLAGAALAAVGALVAFWGSVDRSGTAALAWTGPGPWGLAAAALALGLGVRLAGGGRAYGLALLLFLAALLSKGLVVVLPVVLLVLDVVPFRRLDRVRELPARVLEKTPFFALSIAFGQLALWGQAAQAGTMADWSSHTLGERLLQAAYGLAYYPLRTLLPVGLLPIYELPDSLSPMEPRFAGAVLGVVLVTLALWMLRRRFAVGLAAWIAFAAIVAPVLGLAQSGPQLVADRYSYLACMPLALLGGAGLAALLDRGAPAATGALVAATLWLAGLGATTWSYARVWHDSSSLWEYTVRRDPTNAAAWLNRATALAREAEVEQDPERRTAMLEQALDWLEHSFELRADPRCLGNLARVHALLGDREQALEDSRRALALAREQGVLVANYHLGLGLDLLAVGRLDEGLTSLDRVLQAEPDNLRALLASGRALLQLDRREPAIARLSRAARLEPGNLQVWRNLARAREAAGDRERAIAAWRRVLELSPGHAGALVHLADLGATP